MRLSRRQFAAVSGGGILGATTNVGSAEETHSYGGKSTASDQTVGAHYYTWFGPDNHWDNGYTGEPVLGEYDSKAVEVIDQHITWANAHGIDWLSTTWWGTDSYSGRTLRNYVAPRLAGSPVEFSVLYEPKGLLSFNESSGVVDFDQTHNRDKLAADLTHIAEEYTDNPNYFHIDGRPVIYVYIARTFAGAVTEAFERAQSQAGEQFYLIGDYGRRPRVPNLEVFDAVSPYNMYHPDPAINEGFVSEVEEFYLRWRLLADEHDFLFVPNVLPGFDNTNAAWGSPDAPVLTREPDRYRRQCRVARSAMDPANPVALVTSFNEWHEHTSIEPGEAFGTTYLEITREELATGSVGGVTDSLVPLTFHWDSYVEESELNPDVSPEDSRKLTINLRRITLLDGDERVIRRYDVGSDPEPVFTTGVSGPGGSDGQTWRWLTVGQELRSRMYLPRELAESAAAIEFTALPAADDFQFGVTLGSEMEPVAVTLAREWSTTHVDLPPVETPTPSPTPTPTPSPTRTPTSTPTDQPSPTPTPTGVADPTGSETTTLADGPGVGVLTAVGGLAGAGWHWYRKHGEGDKAGSR